MTQTESDQRVTEMADLDPQVLAVHFARTMREWLTPIQMAIVNRRNSAQRDPTICHSHDFCDANMAMDSALRELMVEEFDGIMLPDGNTPEEIDLGNRRATVWNTAWDLAKCAQFDPDRIGPVKSI